MTDDQAAALRSAQEALDRISGHLALIRHATIDEVPVGGSGVSIDRQLQQVRDLLEETLHHGRNIQIATWITMIAVVAIVVRHW